MGTVTEFDAYKLTNAHVKFDGDTAPEPMGCMGSIQLETTMRQINKKCEGVIVKTISKIEEVDVTITAHFPVPVIRKFFGITNKDLKPGVYSYGNGSILKEGLTTFDLLNLEETDKKLMAIPRLSNSGGLRINHVNGEDEIAEVEISAKALPDENGQYYYEAYESEITDETVKTKWHTEFTPTLVKASTI